MQAINNPTKNGICCLNIRFAQNFTGTGQLQEVRELCIHTAMRVVWWGVCSNICLGSSPLHEPRKDFAPRAHSCDLGFPQGYFACMRCAQLCPILCSPTEGYFDNPLENLLILPPTVFPGNVPRQLPFPTWEVSAGSPEGCQGLLTPRRPTVPFPQPEHKCAQTL